MIRIPRRLGFLLILTCLAAGIAGAGERPASKLDPHLRRYLEPGRQAPLDPVAIQLRQRVLRPETAPLGIRSLIVSDLSRAELEARGVTVVTIAGRVASAYVPTSAIPGLVALPGLERLQASRRLVPHLDLALSETQIQWTHGSSSAPFPGNAGAGVVVGVVDTGFDTLHEDFRTAGGQSRFHAIWDQTDPFGTSPPAFGYGSEWNQAQLTAGTASTYDPVGHGTHVMGIAGGNGRGTGNGQPGSRFVGAAPEAVLLGVQCDFSEAGLIDGVDWIFQTASGLGMHAVVNLSLGTPLGPHDGTTPLDLGIDALTGPGRIVIASSGNSGGQGQHARGAVPVSGSPDAVEFTFHIDPFTPAPSFSDDYAFFEFWYDGADAYEVYLVTPGGAILGPGVQGDWTFDIFPGEGMGQIIHEYPAASNGDVQVAVDVFDAFLGDPPATGDWTIRFVRTTSTAAPIDGWVMDATIPAIFTGPRATDEVTVASPASAHEVIAVGAYASKTSWTSIDNVLIGYSEPPVPGEIASFSSRGPTRDGRQKPELTAPGFGVMSTLASTVDTTGLGPRVERDGVHWLLEGTSMSAPVVSGLAALILAKHGTPLTPAQMVSELAAHARADAQTGPVPNSTWGYGKAGGEAADVLGPTVHLTAPNTAGPAMAGQALLVTWEADDNFGLDQVDLRYSTDGGVTFPHGIATAEPNDGSYLWTVPDLPGSEVLVRVEAEDGAANQGADAADAALLITSTTGLADGGLPSRAVLETSRPNPVRASERIAVRFGLPGTTRVDLRVFDALGREVAVLVDRPLEAGYHEVVWDPRRAGVPLAAGMYVTRLRAGETELARKFLVLR